MSTEELAERVEFRATQVKEHVWNEHAAEALAALGSMWETMSELAPEIVAMGVRQGLTQRRMADLLGVPPSTLRGARREFA